MDSLNSQPTILNQLCHRSDLARNNRTMGHMPSEKLKEQLDTPSPGHHFPRA